MFEKSLDTNVCSVYNVFGGGSMEMLKNRMTIILIVMLLLVAYVGGVSSRMDMAKEGAISANL